MSDHLWSLADTSCGIALVLSKRRCSGLWSERITNFLPNKYPWNFFTSKMMDNPSLSRCAYFLSAGDNVLDANAIGLSPSSVWWERTAPTS